MAHCHLTLITLPPYSPGFPVWPWVQGIAIFCRGAHFYPASVLVSSSSFPFSNYANMWMGETKLPLGVNECANVCVSACACDACKRLASHPVYIPVPLSVPLIDPGSNAVTNIKWLLKMNQWIKLELWVEMNRKVYVYSSGPADHIASILSNSVHEAYTIVCLFVFFTVSYTVSWNSFSFCSILFPEGKLVDKLRRVISV